MLRCPSRWFSNLEAQFDHSPGRAILMHMSCSSSRSPLPFSPLLLAVLLTAILLLAAFILRSSIAQRPLLPPRAQDLPLRVEIRLAQAQSTVKHKAPFSLSTIIRNVGTQAQSLQIWSCSYPQQWIADNPAVHIMGVSCKKNDLIRTTLKPQEAYERPLHVGIAAEHPAHGSLAFRLAFEPVTSESSGTASPIWSNALTVVVTE